MMDKTEWARIPNTNYRVSNEGVVRSVKGETIRQFDDGGGLLMVRLKIDGLFRIYHVHELVAKAFVDNPHDYAKIVHVDGNTQNNEAVNLQWIRASVSHKKPKKDKRMVHQYDGDREVAVYSTAYEAALCTGISKGCIYKALDKPNRTAGGYIFRRE